MIKEEIKSIKSTPADLKKFGLTVGGVFFIIGILMFFFGSSGYKYLLVIGAVLIIPGLLFPAVLKPLNIAWMTLAVLMGFVMTRVILMIAFYLVLTPVSLIAKISGKKFLESGFDKNKITYWTYREKTERAPIDYERQF